MPEVRDTDEPVGSVPVEPVEPVEPVVPVESAEPHSAEAPAAAVTCEPTPAVVAAPQDSGWLRVSPKYVVVEVIGSLIGMAVFVGAFVVAYLLWQQWWALWAAIVIGVVSLVSIAFEPRRVRSIGYRLREDDLLFRRGIMFQRQVAVPYGRMQLVDITRGPVARALGLADLKFVTAAASTAVTVPGLPAEEADRLRDELVALAETRRAGL
jgi:membrane protein YdbS with pleckstrin-like domain